MAMVEGIVSGDIPDTKPPLRKKVAPFVKVILELRKQAKRVSHFLASLSNAA
jgi:hypothetical protein